MEPAGWTTAMSYQSKLTPLQMLASVLLPSPQFATIAVLFSIGITAPPVKPAVAGHGNSTAVEARPFHLMTSHDSLKLVPAGKLSPEASVGIFISTHQEFVVADVEYDPTRTFVDAGSASHAGVAVGVPVFQVLLPTQYDTLCGAAPILGDTGVPAPTEANSGQMMIRRSSAPTPA